MSNPPTIPPTIPASTKFNTNFTRTLHTNKTITDSLTVGTLTFSNTNITGLSLPEDPQDVATREYVIESTTPGGNINNVQFNENDVLSGTDDFTFDSVTKTLTVNGTITDGFQRLSNGRLSNITNTILPNSVTNRKTLNKYGNSFANTTTIESDSGVTYTADQLINGYIIRDTATSNTYYNNVTDKFPTAQDIVNALDRPIQGSSTFFYITNQKQSANNFIINGTSAYDFFQVTVESNTGVTFSPNNSVFLPRYYYLRGRIRVDSDITQADPAAVTVFISSSCISPLPLCIPNTALNPNNYYSALIDTNLKIKGNILFPSSSLTVATTNYTYSISNLQNGYITRNPVGASADNFINLNNLLYSTSFVIRNIGVGTITIDDSAQANWTYSPSSFTIPSNKSVNLYIKNQSDSSYFVYLLGTFDLDVIP